MDWKYLFTSFEGCISRQSFWLGSLALVLVQIVTMLVLFLIVSSTLGMSTNPDEVAATVPAFSIWHWMLLVLIAIFLYPALAIYTKRWHDRGKSGWWSLIYFVPIVGYVWILVELDFLRGTEGPIQYDNDPLA